MKQVGKLNLNLMEGADRLSPSPVNENTRKISGELDYLSGNVQVRKVGGGDPLYTAHATVNFSEKAEGDIVSLVEQGKLVEFRVAKLNYEADLNGEGRTLLVRRFPTGDTVSSYKNEFPAGAGAFLRDTYFNRLGKSLRKAAGSTVVEYNHCYAAEENDSVTEVLTGAFPVFPLSAAEVGLGYGPGELLPAAEAILADVGSDSDATAWLRDNSANWGFTGTGASVYARYAAMLRTTSGTLGVKTFQTNSNSNSIQGGILPAFTVPADLVYTVYTDGAEYYDEQEYGVYQLEATEYRADVPFAMLGNASLYHNSYVGDGSYGTTREKATTIRFPVAPKVWGISCFRTSDGGLNVLRDGGLHMMPWGVGGTADRWDADGESVISLTVEHEGNTAYLMHRNSAAGQLNEDGVEYFFWAFY